MLMMLLILSSTERWAAEKLLKFFSLYFFRRYLFKLVCFSSLMIFNDLLRKLISLQDIELVWNCTLNTKRKKGLFKADAHRIHITAGTTANTLLLQMSQDMASSFSGSQEELIAQVRRRYTYHDWLQRQFPKQLAAAKVRVYLDKPRWLWFLPSRLLIFIPLFSSGFRFVDSIIAITAVNPQDEAKLIREFGSIEQTLQKEMGGR